MLLRYSLLLLFIFSATPLQAAYEIRGKVVTASGSDAETIYDIFKVGRKNSFNIFVYCDPDIEPLCASTEAKMGEDINPFYVRKLIREEDAKLKSYSAAKAKNVRSWFATTALVFDMYYIKEMQIECRQTKDATTCKLTHIN